MNKTQQKFEELLNQIPPEVTEYVNLQGDIAVRIGEILEKKKWTQRQLAKEMGWQESQVTRLLAGHDNLTLKTIAKLSTVLGESIIQIAGKEKSENDFLALIDEASFRLYGIPYIMGTEQSVIFTVSTITDELSALIPIQTGLQISNNEKNIPVSMYEKNCA